MAMPWDAYVDLFRALNTGSEDVPPFDLPRQYETGGVVWTVPNFDGRQAVPTIREGFMALPTPITQTKKMQATIKFNGQGGGWSETVNRAFTPAGSQDPVSLMEQVMQIYLGERRKVLCASNVASQMTIHVIGETAASKPYVQPLLGLGAGLVVGEPAGLDEGLEVNLWDASRRVASAVTFGGFAAADLGTTTTTARDRGVNSPRVEAWIAFLLTWYEDTNGVYLHPGVPFIPSYNRPIEWADAEVIKEWLIDDDLQVLQFITENDLDLSKGDQVIIHSGRNPYVRKVGGTYFVIDTAIDPNGFLTTIRKRACAPLAAYNLAIARVQKKTPQYYATSDAARGLWVRRPNGAGFSARRGRQSGGC